ncbi:SoxR reducing system RseC family protein [Pasteurella sp. PK-2025]|uniref:SoxR reducing system RseC family protein n=1 Tax=Pasteurella sp. PK-2025 TaxID=3413133 RepID=UPI003C751F07
MLKESAVVIAYEMGMAKVKCQSQSACGACAAKNACGASALSELTGEVGEHIFTVETMIPLKVGQRVEIGLAEKSLILSALLIYIVPLLTILISTLIADYLFSHELLSALFIFFCTAFSFLLIRIYAKQLNQKAAYKPILLRVL